MPTIAHPVLQIILPAVAAVVGVPEDQLLQPPTANKSEEIRYAQALCFYVLYIEYYRTHQCIAKLFACNESTVRRALHRLHRRLAKSATTRYDLLQIQSAIQPDRS